MNCTQTPIVILDDCVDPIMVPLTPLRYAEHIRRLR